MNRHLLRNEAGNKTTMCGQPAREVLKKRDPEDPVCGACVDVLIGKAIIRIKGAKL